MAPEAIGTTLWLSVLGDPLLVLGVIKLFPSWTSFKDTHPPPPLDLGMTRSSWLLPGFFCCCSLVMFYPLATRVWSQRLSGWRCFLHRPLSPSCLLWPRGPGCPAAAYQSPGCRIWLGETQLRVGGLGTALCYGRAGGGCCVQQGGRFSLKMPGEGMMLGHHGNGSQHRDAGEAAVCPGSDAGGARGAACPGPGLISNLPVF